MTKVVQKGRLNLDLPKRLGRLVLSVRTDLTRLEQVGAFSLPSGLDVPALAGLENQELPSTRIVFKSLVDVPLTHFTEAQSTGTRTFALYWSRTASMKVKRFGFQPIWLGRRGSTIDRLRDIAVEVRCRRRRRQSNVHGCIGCANTRYAEGA
jgi:hypothetical protein